MNALKKITITNNTWTFAKWTHWACSRMKIIRFQRGVNNTILSISYLYCFCSYRRRWRSIYYLWDIEFGNNACLSLGNLNSKVKIHCKLYQSIFYASSGCLNSIIQSTFIHCLDDLCQKIKVNIYLFLGFFFN